MTSLNLILILVCVLGISVGQILFKLASESIPTSLNLSQWITFSYNKYFILALLIYGVSTILWIFALKRVELNIAYPFMALAFVIVPVMGYLNLGEELKVNTILGACIIIIGLVVSTR